MNKTVSARWLCVATLVALATGPASVGAQATPRTEYGHSAEDIVRALAGPSETSAPPRQGLTRNLILTNPSPVPAGSRPEIAPAAPAAPVKTAAVNLNILFAPNSNAIRTESASLLGELGKALRHDALAGKRVVIAGHTDSDGSEAANRRLSLGRAQAVKRVLVDQYGLDSDAILVEGHGSSRPLAPNTSVENKRLNRRVEVRLGQ